MEEFGIVAEKVLVSGFHVELLFPLELMWVIWRGRNVKTFEGVEMNFVKLTIASYHLFSFVAPMKFLGV